MLVETIAKRSQNIPWELSVTKNGGKEKFSHEKIRRVSMDKFYDIVFNDPEAFFKLCKALPNILDDVIKEDKSTKLVISVYDELSGTDFNRDIYLLAFSTYEGFDKF